MNSFMVSLQGTSRSGSSSSRGGCNVMSPSDLMGETSMHQMNSYLAGCDVHDEVHRREIAREREAVLNELEDGEPHRPDVRADGIVLSRYAFGLEEARGKTHRNKPCGGISDQLKMPVAHRHVFGRPGESAGARADELAGNAKVAELDYTLPRKEDVRWLDVPVNDLLRVQVRKALQDLPIRNRVPIDTWWWRT